VLAGGQVPGPQSLAWDALQAAVGWATLRRGRARDRAGPRARPPLSGVVEGRLERMVTLRLDEPAPGLAFVGVGGPDDETVSRSCGR
jgi:hypothetical protein